MAVLTVRARKDKHRALHYDGHIESLDALRPFAAYVQQVSPGGDLKLGTDHGVVVVGRGDYIVKTSHGHLQVYKPESFALYFEEAKDG